MALSTTQRGYARLKLEDRYGITCAIPGCERTDTEVDHIQALAAGGSDDLDNLQLLCRSHNASKGAGAVIVGGTGNANAEHLDAIITEGAELYSEVLRVLKRHIWLSEEWAFTVPALWVFVAQAGFREYLTHLPILSITSPRPAMGKSTATRIIHGLLPDSRRYSTLSNHKVLVRGGRSTYVLDEVRDMEPWKGEFHAYLNASVEAGATVPILEPQPDGTWEPTDFPAFTALVLGGLNQRLHDDTLSRCLRITMEALPGGVAVEEFDHHNSPEAKAVEELGQQLAAWADKAGPYIVAEFGPGLRRKRAVPSFLQGRDRDKWSSMFAVASLLGSLAQLDVVMAAIDYRSVESEGRIRSDVEVFTEALAAVLDDGETVSVEGFVPTKNLITALHGGYPETFGNLAERPLKGQGLGHLIRALGGPEARQVRVKGQRNPVRGWHLTTLQKLLDKASPSGVSNRAAVMVEMWRGIVRTLAQAYLQPDEEGD